jgi:hypothetical protein
MIRRRHANRDDRFASVSLALPRGHSDKCAVEWIDAPIAPTAGFALIRCDGATRASFSSLRPVADLGFAKGSTHPAASYPAATTLSSTRSAIIRSSTAIKTLSTHSPPAWRLGHRCAPTEVQNGLGSKLLPGRRSSKRNLWFNEKQSVQLAQKSLCNFDHGTENRRRRLSNSSRSLLIRPPARRWS